MGLITIMIFNDAGHSGFRKVNIFLGINAN